MLELQVLTVKDGNRNEQARGIMEENGVMISVRLLGMG